DTTAVRGRDCLATGATRASRAIFRTWQCFDSRPCRAVGEHVALACRPRRKTWAARFHSCGDGVVERACSLESAGCRGWVPWRRGGLDAWLAFVSGISVQRCFGVGASGDRQLPGRRAWVLPWLVVRLSTIRGHRRLHRSIPGRRDRLICGDDLYFHQPSYG